MKQSFLITVTITVALLSATTTTAQQPECASKLVPCAPYLNSTKPKPPASCCDPLREAVTTDLACLCKLYENPTLLPSLGINVTLAIGLPKYCNIPGDVTACKAAAPSSGSPSKTTPAAKDKSGVSRVAWTGMSSLLVLFASFVLA
ncbi:non-specific lipid transfer protein GPI-anchored 7-like [Lycium ferocissimum]|uniref:non-specific lipid transfer protein GPI-anchored 7-like n=1 Tax=Lycium ferocissimum TaxID=112874 RepID=UPI0028160C86|nr:non-specific lipid transfer protein GPI-anchored 7-like [Lycium ferocissimum]